jgi:hypothetical protein
VGDAGWKPARPSGGIAVPTEVDVEIENAAWLVFKPMQVGMAVSLNKPGLLTRGRTDRVRGVVYAIRQYS